MQSCDLQQARTPLRQADSFIEAADAVLLLADGVDDVATPSVAASLAVLAGIAASDAACCARLQSRPRGQNHVDAVPILATVVPHGIEMSKDLARLLQRKDDAHYGLSLVSEGDATKMVGWAKRLTARAQNVVDST